MDIHLKTPEDLLWALRLFRPVPLANNQDDHKHSLGYMVFLGAGPSIEAGIPGSPQLLQHALRSRRAQNPAQASSTLTMSDAEIEQWAREAGYYDPSDERSKYAQVMNSLFDTPALREEFVRRELKKARVSDGYRILGELIKLGVFDTILTTNFDYLVRQGADIVLPFPIEEVNSIEQYGRLKAFSTDPRIVRLHGDFWHGNLRNTEEELIRTPTVIYEAAATLFRSYGAIVIGYGGEDTTLMQEVFRNKEWQNPDFLRSGLYWCDIKEPKDLAPKVKSFLAEGAKVGRAFYVKIEGFTALMRQMGVPYGVEMSLEQDMEKDIKKYWEWFALLTELADGVTRDEGDQDFRQRHFERLVQLLGTDNAVCASRKTESGKWEVNVVPRTPFSIFDDESLLTSLGELHGRSPDYQQTWPDELSNTNIFHEYLKDCAQIESFPVWKKDQLIGLVSFASKGQPLINHQRLRLIRSAIKLLVDL